MPNKFIPPKFFHRSGFELKPHFHYTHIKYDGELYFETYIKKTGHETGLAVIDENDDLIICNPCHLQDKDGNECYEGDWVKLESDYLGCFEWDKYNLHWVIWIPRIERDHQLTRHATSRDDIARGDFTRLGNQNDKEFFDKFKTDHPELFE